MCIMQDFFNFAVRGLVQDSMMLGVLMRCQNECVNVQRGVSHPEHCRLFCSFERDPRPSSTPVVSSSFVISEAFSSIRKSQRREKGPTTSYPQSKLYLFTAMIVRLGSTRIKFFYPLELSPPFNMFQQHDI